MAEYFLFSIAENVLGKLSSQVLQEVSLAWRLESHRKKLEETLNAIKAVLLDAEQQQEHNYKIKVWLGKLKEVLYDAEDVLDEFECEALRRQVLARSSVTRKVRRFFSSSNSLAFYFRIADEIKQIQGRVVEIASQKSTFDLTEQFQDRQVMYRERELTHSYVCAADVFGREEDKEEIIKALMHHVDGENVSIIPIVGIGGLGKTTLAKLVYNDTRVAIHFELKIWACVANDFDEKNLIVKIIKSATLQDYSNLDLDQLQIVLREILDGRKYLLILDDVWNDDPRKWFELKTLLTSGDNGSKIIVTTRSNRVASIMGTAPAHNLKGLSDNDSLSLFLKCAFREGHAKQNPNLVEIGEEIVKKCKGVPLALVTLGTLLYSKTDDRDWKFLRDNEIWRLEQKENDILPALRLSYEQLPSYLKRCFAYCSIFPKDYVFLDIELVQFWMAQGLVQSSNDNQELEDVCFRYLKELQSRCFFQDFKGIPGFARCKMHDLMHDLALSMMQNEFSMITFCRQPIIRPRSVRHLLFIDPEPLPQDLRMLLQDLKSLRTVSFYSEREKLIAKLAIDACLSRSQYLRVLDLSNFQFEVLPKRIGRMKHLRYLNLSGNGKIKQLPSSIWKLQNLQTLMLFGCVELEELPSDIRYMISLRFLWITTKQKFLPRNGIGRLKSLQFLCISACENLQSLFADTEGLKSLRTLVIGGCGSLISLPQNMKYLNSLEALVIANCERLSLTMEEGNENENLSGFSLRKLILADLPNLVNFPQWLLRQSTNTLQTLQIESCFNLEELPECMQNLGSLQELQIKSCPLLSGRCKQGNGAYWPRIAHIPSIIIDD